MIPKRCSSWRKGIPGNTGRSGGVTAGEAERVSWGKDFRFYAVGGPRGEM
jgi:hypothetical protein